MFSLRLAFNLVTRPDYTCRTIVIFGTLQDWSLLITSNSLALNNCFRYRPDGRYECLFSRKETKGLIISLCWYGSKDHHFTLLPGHILYRKPGGHKIVCTGVKFKSYFNVVKNHFSRFLLLQRFRKSIFWPIYDVRFVVIDEEVRGQFFGSTGVKQVKMLQFCWQKSQNDRLVNTIQIQNSLLCVACFSNMVMQWES